MPTPKKPIEERYIINSQTNCWEWIAAKNSKGYGTLTTTIFGWRQTMLAHKYFFIIYRYANKDTPKGYDVHHKCKNRSCVNPNHLELISHLNNCRIDRKLNQDQINEIRRRYPKEKQDKLAEEFNVTQAYISKIVRNEIWK